MASRFRRHRPKVEPMAVDRVKRSEIADHIAALMRGDADRYATLELKRRLFPKKQPASDSLAHQALNRLEKHWRGTFGRGQMPMSEWEWCKLHRWLALLQTNADWNQR